MRTTEQNHTDAGAIIEAVERLAAPNVQVIRDPASGESVVELLYPSGVERAPMTETLDRRLPHPRRMQGFVQVDDVESFVRLVERNKISDGQTVVYVSRSSHTNGIAPCVTAVLNDCEAETGKPGWRDYGVMWAPELSASWVSWSTICQKEWRTQAEFAEHLKAQCLDIVDPETVGAKTKELIRRSGLRAAMPADVVHIGRGLSLRVESEVKDVRHLDSGEVQIAYSEKHRGEDGKPIVVPTALVLGVPVFRGGPVYSVVVALRYRVSQGQVVWSLKMLGVDALLDDAFGELQAELAAKLPGVTVVSGANPPHA